MYKIPTATAPIGPEVVINRFDIFNVSIWWVRSAPCQNALPTRWIFQKASWYAGMWHRYGKWRKISLGPHLFTPSLSKAGQVQIREHFLQFWYTSKARDNQYLFLIHILRNEKFTIMYQKQYFWQLNSKSFIKETRILLSQYYLTFFWVLYINL